MGVRGTAMLCSALLLGHHSDTPEGLLPGVSWGLWPGPSQGSGSLPHRVAGDQGSIYPWGSFSLAPPKSGFSLFPMCLLRTQVLFPQNLLSPWHCPWHTGGVL